jgi:hypothetical protein
MFSFIRSKLLSQTYTSSLRLVIQSACVAYLLIPSAIAKAETPASAHVAGVPLAHQQLLLAPSKTAPGKIQFPATAKVHADSQSLIRSLMQVGRLNLFQPAKHVDLPAKSCLQVVMQDRSILVGELSQRGGELDGSPQFSSDKDLGESKYDTPGDIDPVVYVSPLGRGRLSRGTNSPHAQALRLPLKEKLEYCLRLYGSGKLENIEGRSPWGIMHVAISLGQFSEAQYQNRKVNAVNWLLNNGQCRGERLMYLDGDGKLQTRSGPGFEGHEGQLLAILAQSAVEPHTEIFVESKQFTLLDLIKKEMDSCQAGTELTFKLIGLSYYLDSDATWKSSDGETWDIQRLISEEIKQPINGVACGGSHRLMGLAFSLQRRRLQNRPVDGEWARAETFIQDYKQYTLSLANADGSFSTNWFEGREAMDNSQRRLQTTGHILEWLVFASDDQEVQDPRVVRSVNYLASLMLEDSETEWSVGPKGHAIRALDLFYRRVYKGETIPTARFGDPRMLR